MKYALIDTANTFFRARHVASRNSDNSEKVAMALHLTLASVNQVVRNHKIDHVVFCLEGRSFRKDFYAPYKRNRLVKSASLTEKDVELDKLFWETYEQFTTFIKDKTNASILRCPIAEADDLIARFIHLHPDDEHFIISTDGDFAQLIAPNVKQYSGIVNHLITIDGYYDDRGREVKDKKTGLHKKLGDPGFLLFEKCMRGDAGDNVFSAYPGVRTKSSKKSIGLTEAYADRHQKGFNWNNMMLQRWVDHEGKEHRVLDDYNRNVSLCDLTAQPDSIKETIDNSITDQIKTDLTSNVGVHFMKFCSKYELVKISEQAETYARWLNAPYKGNTVSVLTA